MDRVKDHQFKSVAHSDIANPSWLRAIDAPGLGVTSCILACFWGLDLGVPEVNTANPPLDQSLCGPKATFPFTRMTVGAKINTANPSLDLIAE